MNQAHENPSPIVQGAFVRAARVYAKEARCEIVSLVRERPYIFSVLGLPTVFYLVFGIAHPGEILQGHPIARYLLASYAAFGAMGAAMFAVGVGLVMERSHGWLELKRASPMPVHAYLSAKIAASLVFGELIAIVLLALGYALSGLHVSAVDMLRLAIAIAGGVLAFSTLGTLLGLLLSPGSAVGIINLIYLPLSLCGGLWVPLEMLPRWLQAAAPFLPSYQFSRIALDALGYAVGPVWTAWAVLITYAAAFALASIWLFKHRQTP